MQFSKIPTKLFYLCLFAFLFNTTNSITLANKQFIRCKDEINVEPTYWWVGMKKSTFQVMLYGKNIADYKVLIKDKNNGISISKIKTTDNPNYLFLYLNISKDTKPGKFDIILKNNFTKKTIRYELKERKPNSAMRESFSEKDNLYLIMPDRFANADTSNDSVKGYYEGVNREDLGERQGGDIEGIIQKIPYLADLGITALWTTPLLEDNDTQYSYHHYACTDYYKIDPRLGKDYDYLRLSEEAAKYGIKLIIDIVPNHCSKEHWWLKDIPAEDWFNTWSKYTSSNYRMTAWTDPHASKADLQRLTKGWFSHNMPDFNLDNPLLFDYLRQAYIFWIERANISGIRVDTYPYNNIQTAARFIQSIRDEYPLMNVVGECWVKTPAEIAYYQSGNNNKDGFDSRLQSVMDFVLKDKLTEAFNEKEGWETGMAKFYSHFAQDFVYPNANFMMNFLDNHDIDRYTTTFGGDIDKYKMGLAMLTTVRGYPQIYYGTEIMLDGIPGNYEGHRFTFPGGWSEDKHSAFSPSQRTEKENEIFNYLRKLLNYRKNSTALQSGKMTQFIPENGIYVFFRYDKNSTVMVVCNNNENTAELKTERFAEIIKKSKKAVEITTGKTYDVDKKINIEGKTVLVLELIQNNP